MLSKRFLNLILSLALVFANLAAPFSAAAQVAQQANAKQQTAQADMAAKLATIEQTLDAKRKEYGIPGMSLAIVKDDQIIYMKGLGVKDLEKNAPVTPDTLFAIGSSTKAFTALTVLMGADEGKLSLDDSPKKLLPYFKMSDPETDSKITIRDLLSHSSGLNRTDLAFAVGTLNREEVIRVAGLAKPTARLREKFQYQNAMFTVAGEVAARAEGKPWEKIVETRIFKPLGMKDSNISVKEMEKARDYSYGYEYNTDTKQNRRLPMRDIPQAAPAGAINSSARDMAQWLRFMLAGGTYNGKRLVSEKSFTEFTSPQMKITGKVSYGLGWFLRDWNGHKVVEHGGNIDGFNALVAMMPDQKLGFVMLTNISGSPLGQDAMQTIWTNLVGKPEGDKPSQADNSGARAAGTGTSITGTYKFAEAGMNVEVAMIDGKLVMTVPGQPQYTLENVGGRRYKLIYPGLEGFFATFRPVKEKTDETEMYLEQPQGNYVLSRLKADEKAKEAEAASSYSGPMKELLGSYKIESGQALVEVTIRDGKVSLVVPGQQPYALTEKAKDAYTLPPLPADAYWMNVKRDAAGNVSAIAVTQPEGVFTFVREAKFAATMSADELMAKVIEASGGEALRKHKSMVTKFEANFIHQGITGEGTSYAKAPNMQASNTNLMALGRKVGSTFEYFDGTTGGQDTSFTPGDVLTGKQLANTKLASDFYGLLNWKTLFKTVEVKRMDKVAGEDVYVVVMTPEGANPVTLYISTKTFLPLRRDTIYTASDSTALELPVTETYSDYRSVEGMMMPFKAVTNSLSQGDIIVEIKEVKFDVDIPDTTFKPQAKK